MNCSRLTFDLLVDYADRRLDRETRQQTDQHLARCGACRDRYQEARQIARKIQSVMADEPPATLMLQLDSAIRSMKLQRPVAPWRRFLGGAIGVAAALLVAFLIGRQLLRDEPAPSSAQNPARDHVADAPQNPPVAPPEPPAPPSAVAQSPQPPPPPPAAPPVPNESPAEVVQAPVETPQTPLVSELPPAVPVKRGDFNQNGKLDRSDLEFLTNLLLAGRLYDPRMADLNGDGLVDCGDGLTLLLELEARP